MPLLVALAIYGGTYFGYVSYDTIVAPYLSEQAAQDAKEFPVDALGLNVEQENESAFNALQ